ncbi:T9SS type A sorting domain-containing protein [Mucilaginibacter robiniae]|uniref:T9SS type A sorting domain-containing protein n=1 Tax=Mucilaginibacter robiniae TaxID=2728022 RepID=A0A7L5DVW8_9SPHI|nr:MBG domain-containing protein [Mucilaginibacter robiniae]QJD95232.1 T9SS type A sorting domain-containing protein [Mucilaginibacter robiniae]
MFGSDCNVIVADNASHLIRKVSVSGYTITPALPAGLNFDSATGTISGTPTIITPAANYTITANNYAGTSTTTVSIGVKALSLPNIAYNIPQQYVVNKVITPLVPANTGGTIPANSYGEVSTFMTNTTVNLDNIGNMVVDTYGNFYAIDNTGNAIKKITPNGAVSTFASINNLLDIAIDPSNNIYVAAGSYSIQKITPAGAITKLTESYGTVVNGVAKFKIVHAITVDKNGNVYVSDPGNKIIWKVTSSGIMSALAGNSTNTGADADGVGSAANFNNPQAITVDNAGNVYVAEGYTNAIRKITPDGGVTTLVDKISGVYKTGVYYSVNDMTIDQLGNLYVVDNSYHIVRKITPDGKVSTLVGSGNASYVDGVGTAASFKGAYGLTIDISGNLFVIDSYPNNGSTIERRLRKITLGGYVINPALPAGLSFEGTTGTISGTPTTFTSAQDYTVTAYNLAGSNSAKVNIAVTNPNINFAALLPATYGDADIALTAKSDNAAAPITYVADNTQVATIVNGNLHIMGAGTVNVTASQIGTADVTQSLTIAKKELIVTANDQTRAYGKSDPDFTVGYSGFVNNDDVSQLATLPSVTTTATATSDAGTYSLVPSGASANNYSFVYHNGTLTIMPAVTNFKVSATSVTCKGENNGIININAIQTAAYTAILTGNGNNKSYSFNTDLSIDKLSPGTYNVCITNAALNAYQQCFNLTITEPKDLTVYSTVNKLTNTINLILNGSSSYTVQLNGTVYRTSNSSLTLPLDKGNNKISVSTDKPCQGIIEQIINPSDNTTPYPNPFQNVLYINLGENTVANCAVKIYNVANGSLQSAAQFNNQSGVISLDVSRLMLGIYSLHLMMDGKETVYKIIKQ